MKASDNLRGCVIKSFVIDNSYEWIAGGSEYDLPGEYERHRIDGFCVLARGSRVGQNTLVEDEVAAFEFSDTGFTICETYANYLGLVRAGEELPEWMRDCIEKPFRRNRTKEAKDGR